MRIIGIDKAMFLAGTDPTRLRRYDYVIDEHAWFIPVDSFLDWLFENRRRTAEVMGVKT